jgi:hypothetical protein
MEPACALVVVPDSTHFSFSKQVLDRRLVIGWRTWFGPAYVERYGSDWLMGLPGTTHLLPGGGVAHGLGVPLADLLLDRGDPYAEVREYVAAAGHTLAWPRPPKRARKSKAAAVKKIRDDIGDFLDTTIELGDGRRVKMLPLPWSAMTPEERTVALEEVPKLVEQDIQAHPESTVHFETGELPDDLRAALDAVAARTGRLTYALVPELAIPSEVWIEHSEF